MLNVRQVHTFYEAVGYMVAAQPNRTTQEKLLTKLMELPNTAVRVVFHLLSFMFYVLTTLTVGRINGPGFFECGRS